MFFQFKDDNLREILASLLYDQKTTFLSQTYIYMYIYVRAFSVVVPRTHSLFYSTRFESIDINYLSVKYFAD